MGAADGRQCRGAARHRAPPVWPIRSLTPNLEGFEAALAAGAQEIAVFGAASETFSQRNINCSIAESLERFGPVIDAAKQNGMRVRGYVSCVLGCPYEGDVLPGAVAEVAGTLFDMGCYEVSLGDTIGVGTPGRTRKMIETVARRIPIKMMAGHFHDTYGLALTNIYASLESGVAVFDASVGGLGAVPMRPEPRERCHGRRDLHAGRPWHRYRYRPRGARRYRRMDLRPARACPESRSRVRCWRSGMRSWRLSE